MQSKMVAYTATDSVAVDIVGVSPHDSQTVSEDDMAQELLMALALKAVGELEQSGEWKTEEGRFACFNDHEPQDVTSDKPVRALIMFILRGESPQGVYVYFEIKPTARRRRPIVDSIKRQIRDHFQSDEQYDWPPAFTIQEFREKFPRTFSDWSLDEESCYAFLKAKGTSRETLAGIFQRSPGAALVPQNEVNPPFIEPDKAIYLLGVEVRCSNCFHSPLLTYAILTQAAKKAGAELATFSKQALLGVLGQFRCKRCGSKGPRLKAED